MIGIIFITAMVFLFLMIIPFQIENSRGKAWYAVVVLYCLAAIIAISYLVGCEWGQKKALNGEQVFRKEYTYKQLPSGEYVKTDSSYVRIKTKDHGGKREK